MTLFEPIVEIIPAVFHSFFEGNYYGLAAIGLLTILGLKAMSLVWSAAFAIVTVTWISSMVQLAQQQEFAWAPVLLAGSVIMFVSFYLLRWVNAD